MHDIVRENLEDYLRRAESSRGPAGLEQHLSACAECREMVNSMRETAQVLESLRPPRDIEPSAGFYARVMARIDSERKPSVWNLLLDPVFGKRLVYASLTLVLLLGTYLVSTEPNGIDLAATSSPEVILSDQGQAPVLTANTEQDRDAILVNLATYKE